MSEEERQRDIIDELIEKVDDPVHGWKPLSVWEKLKLGFAKIILMFIVALLMVYIFFALREQQFVTLSVIVSASAFLVTVYSLLYGFTKVDRAEVKRKTIDWNYKRIKERVDNEHCLLLKPLIHMRTLQGDFKLSEVRKKYPSLFNEENLVGMLYDFAPLSIKTYEEKNTKSTTKVREQEEETDTKRLIAEYNVLNEAIWRRDQVSLLVNSIMISATLGIITFAIRFRSELGRSILTGLPNAGFIPLLCLILIVIPYLLWWTSTKLDTLCFDRIHEIEDILQIKGHHSILEHIKCNTWYKFRRHMWHVVFLLFIVVYLFTSYWLFRETVIP